MKLTRFEKIAARAVAARLKNTKEPTLTLFQVSYTADAAAREAGKKRDLYECLDRYARLLPPGTRTGWHNHFLCVTTGRDPSFEFGGAAAGAFDAAIDLGPGQGRLPSMH